MCPFQYEILFLLTVTCKSGTAGKLTGVAGVHLNIFTANSMECEGRVIAWEFYSRDAGQIYLGLWDYNLYEHTFTLTGKNLLTVGSTDIGKSKVCKLYFFVCLYLHVCVCVCVCRGVCFCICVMWYRGRAPELEPICCRFDPC